MAIETGLLASEVLSTLAKSTMLFVIPATIPVKVGLCKGALPAKALVISAEFAFSARAVVTSVLN